MRTELKGEGVDHLVSTPLSGTNRWTDWIQRVPESRRIGAIKKTFIFSGCKEDLSTSTGYYCSKDVNEFTTAVSWLKGMCEDDL